MKKFRNLFSRFLFSSFSRKSKDKRGSWKKSKLCSNLIITANVLQRKTTKIFFENVFLRYANDILVDQIEIIFKPFFFQVCHSKKGDINPTKIQKLVKGYVRKYKATRKKGAGPFPM